MLCLVILPGWCTNNVGNSAIVSNYGVETAAVILRSLKLDSNHNPVLGMGRNVGGSGQGGSTECRKLHTGVGQACRAPGHPEFELREE